MSKINRILLIIFLFSIEIIHAQTIDATKFCEQFNAILATWSKSNFTECQGAIINTNEQLKATKYKSIKPINGALKTEVLAFKNAPNLNTVSIIFYESELFDENISANFKIIFNLLKNCVKTYTMELNSGFTNGQKDDDGDLPDMDFTKKGAPSINIAIEEPTMDKTFKVIITIEEPADE